MTERLAHLGVIQCSAVGHIGNTFDADFLSRTELNS
jgi:hypothetical protein